MKNAILVGIIVVCLGVAGFVFLKGSGDGGSGIPEGATILTLCMECKNVQEMDKQEYYDQIRERQVELAEAGNPMAKAYLTCEQCGKPAVTEAMKCEKCEEVFRKGAVPGDYADKCPDCGYSPTEARYKERMGG